MDIEESIKELESLSPSEMATETILKELEKKDKIIDKLSYSLADYVMYYEYDKCRNPEMIKNKAKELKQYFERKVEDESSKFKRTL